MVSYGDIRWPPLAIALLMFPFFLLELLMWLTLAALRVVLMFEEDEDVSDFEDHEGTVLVVLLHGLGATAASMGHIKKAILAGKASSSVCTLPEKVDILNVDRRRSCLDTIFGLRIFGFLGLFSFDTPQKTTKIVADRITKAWCNTTKRYNEVVLVGTSIGAVVMRNVYLAAQPDADEKGDSAFPVLANLPPLEVCQNQQFEDARKSWGPQTHRLVLLSATNRGFSFSSSATALNSFWDLNFLSSGLLPYNRLLVGLLGVFNITPFIFNFQRGSRHICLSRLYWLRMVINRTLKPAAPPTVRPLLPPLVVQLAGSQDDGASLEDDVDLLVLDAIRGSRSPPAVGNHGAEVISGIVEAYHENRSGTGGGSSSEIGPENQSVPADNVEEDGDHFVYLTVLHCGHLSILHKVDPETIITAVFAPPEILAKVDESKLLSSTHGQLRDRVGLQRDADMVTNVVFVMHGIRDLGFWTSKVARTIQKVVGDAAQPEETASKLDQKWRFQCLGAGYGYFGALPFLLAWDRQSKVEWFMDQYVSAVAEFPHAQFHFVGHSNGTFVAAQALRQYPFCRFGRVVFAGSVVTVSYDWKSLRDEERVESMVNFVATADYVVALLPKIFQVFPPLKWLDLGLGSAGTDGFEYDGFKDDAIVGSAPNQQLILETSTDAKWMQFKYVDGGHGAGVEDNNWGRIARFVARGTIDCPAQDGPQPSWVFQYVVKTWWAPYLLWVLLVGGVLTGVVYIGIWIAGREPLDWLWASLVWVGIITISQASVDL